MTLPQKIRLLADFAGYPAGEYAYYDEKGFPSYLQSYIAWDEPVVVNIHPDIIKATSWQGIRSEVTDGEESVSRHIENWDCSKCWNFWVLYDKSCARCTPPTEPIERDWMDKAFDWYYNNESDMAETGDLVILDYDRKMFRMAIERFLPEEEWFSTPEECLKACDEAIKNDSGLDLNPIARDRIESWPVFVPLSRKLEDNQLLWSSIPESPPLESKYEECAKEIQEVLNRRELRWNFPVLDRVMEAVKKYF